MHKIFYMPKRKSKKVYPLVSLCTPTFNRRPFFKAMIQMVESQNYPKDKLEWIIVDDGTDPVGDLVDNLSYVKYIRVDTKMTLGAKRNLMHTHCNGEFIVYMDDDDYYPPERVSHAVTMLQSHPSYLCAGVNELYIYFPDLSEMYKYQSQQKNHATAASFAFRKTLLDKTKFNENALFAEEKEFLHNYTIPMLLLEPKKTILVVSHRHNTTDKKTLIANNNPYFTKNEKIPRDFIKEPELYKFFIDDLDDVLEEYQPGKPEMKPDVLTAIQNKEKELEDMQKKNQQQLDDMVSVDKDKYLTFPLANGQKRTLSALETVQTIHKYEMEIIRLRELCEKHKIKHH